MSIMSFDLRFMEYLQMTLFPIIGDPEKSFHLPECQCPDCEEWRDRNYPIMYQSENKNIHRNPQVENLLMDRIRQHGCG